jgi:FAD/FMN-containing dehydrogenase
MDAPDSSHLSELIALLPPGAVRTDAETMLEFGRDWTRLHEPRPLAIAFPASTEQTAAVVRWARAHKVALVPSGGRTGLSGGAVAHNGQLVVSMVRMNRVIGVSPADRVFRGQAGVTIKTVQDEAKRYGLMYPIDFAPTDTMQLGGTIATNAGGVHVLRYGMTRDWVAGLTAVIGSGEVLDLSVAVRKNNVGYDLKQLLIGSEGTLGIITEASVRLAAPPSETSLALLAVHTADDLLACAEQARRYGSAVLALEFWDNAGMTLSLGYLKRPPPSPVGGDSRWYLLGEFEGRDVARLWSLACQADRCCASALVEADEERAKALWQIRLKIGSSVAPYTPYKNDISVPVSALPAFLPALADVLGKDRAGERLVVWGHLGDGNLHINCLKPDAMPLPDFAAASRRVDDHVYDLVTRCGGSISAEHGIGLMKKHALSLMRSPPELAALRGIKSVFDPDGIMNPGKIFD